MTNQDTSSESPVEAAAPSVDGGGVLADEGLKLSGRSRTFLLVAVALVIAAQVIIRNAWLSDDAFITCRTIDNFLHGWGLRWNVGERVQSYTHPLWMFVNLCAVWVTSEYFYTLLATCLVCSLGGVTILFRDAARSVSALVFALMAVVMSKAFVDYSTSGLENPLSHLLLVVLLHFHLKKSVSTRQFAVACLVGCLIVLNRMDLAVIVGPIILAMFWPGRSWRWVGIALLAGLPFLAWEIFSIVYYGFPFPNTAYAKIGSGFPKSWVAFQSLFYFVNSIEVDPVTLCVTIAALVAAATVRTRQNIAMAIGILLYLLYVVRIGGGFMSGRFFAAPFLVAVVMITYLIRDHWKSWIPAAAVLGLGLCAPVPPPMLNSENADWKHEFENGIADEQGVYLPTQGLVTAQRSREMPATLRRELGLVKRDEGPAILYHPSVGILGLYAGPEVHIVDRYALCDPLLARLPAEYEADWRPGHMIREMPWGYYDSIRTGKNVIQDKNLAEFYNHLLVVLNAPLFDGERLREIWRFNTGKYDHLIEAYVDAPEEVRVFKAADLTLEKTGEFKDWEEKDRRFDRPGARIEFDETIHTPALELTLDNASSYDLAFRRDGKSLDEVHISRREGKGYIKRRVAVPPPVCEDGYDSLFLRPSSGTLVGHVCRVQRIEEGLGPAFDKPWGADAE
ncbi:hypothetical protein KQI84_18420 [bacterium]|nr:hypothetical protein [bacterium]